MSHSLAFIEGVGGSELVMIMFIILLLFGSDKLPALAKGLGKTVREFKKAASGLENEVRRAMDEAEEEPLPKKFPSYPPPSGAVQQAISGTPVPPAGTPAPAANTPPLSPPPTPPPPAAPAA